MNRLCYRVVFNRARGALMVVPETMPSRQAGGHSQRLLIGSVLVSVLSTTLLPMSARAQIIPDTAAPTNRQPIVTTASNGVPLVNIQTPSAGGVSRNAFSQFDVSGRGAIVNNANQSVQTMLGGWVQANPLLALPATVIVNEVNSSHPSLLRGYLEIAGQAAKLVIANPSGISCDGCGFINASRATLTTGVPQYSANGNLDSYLVRGGTVQFDGDGLDAQGADFTDVIARAVRVNAALRARQLNVIAGSNVVDASDLHTTTLADSNGKPQVAIDVSALGGMYANKIWLVATEAGVGVRQAGTLGGGADDIRITSAGSLEVTGVIDSTRQLDINVAGCLINYGTINSDDSVSLNSATEIEHRGLIHGGEVLLQSPTIKNLGSGRIYGEHIAIAANSLISDIDASASATTSTTTTNSRGDPEPISFTPVIAARSRLDIGAEQITNREGALLYSEGDMSIGGRLDAQRHATGQARRLDNLSAQIEAGGNMSLAVDDIRNVNTHYSTRKQTKPLESIVEFAGSGSPNRYREGTHDVYTYIDESTHLHTPEGNYESWLLYRYQRSVSEDVTDESIPAQVTAGGNLHVRGQTLTNDKSRILAGKDLDVQVTTLNNIDATGTRTVIDQGTVKAFWRHHKKGSDSTRAAEENYEPPAQVQTISLGVVGYQDQTSTDPTRIPNTADINHGADNVTRYIKLAAALPASSLYRSAPEASGYLVETDPRFTNRRQWLSSDYLLQQLALDPQQLQKRLGDGFYEQRLVREQIAQLTGRRFLTGYADDESQFQALMNNASTYAQAHQLRPGVALSAEQMAALTSDVVWLVEHDITLPSGQTTRALVPQVYVRTRDGDLNTEGALLGGDQINISLTGDLNNGGTIAGRQIVNLNAENVNNLTGAIAADSVNVHTVQDINVIGGSINADSALVINAGNDIHLASTTASTITAQGSRSARDRVAGLYVSRNDGQMIVTAGHDLSIKAATIQQGQAVTDRAINMARADSIPESNAKAPSIQSDSPSAKSSTKSSTVSAAASNMINPTGRVMLAAGNDVQLDTVTETRSESVNWGGGNYRSESRRSETAATIDTAGLVDIVAGRDIISRGAHITARDGDINAMARRDVTLSTSESAVSLDEAHRHTRRGFLSSATISTRDTLEQTTQLGTLLSGNDVNIQSGQDIHIKGSNIVSSHTTSLDAGRKVSIAAATDTRTESHQYQKQSSGIMGSGGFGVTIGTRSLSTTSNVTATTASAATVGSTEGNVGISAGDSVAQTGSDLIAPQGDVTIAARKVDITAARNTETIITDTQFKQSGLTVAISNPIVNAVQTAQAMTAAASNTKDSRMKALAAANTAMAAKVATDAVLAGQGSSINGKPDQIGTGNDAAGNATSRDANTVDKLGGVQLAISVGTIKNNSHGVVNQTEVVASTIAAGGDVSIIAASGQALSSSAQSDPKQHEIIQSNIKQSNQAQSNTPQSDITIRGSQINAGHQLTLLAEHALDLQAASNTQTRTSANSNSSRSLGVVLNSKGGFGINASGSRGQGKADGEDQHWSNTRINAGQQAVLQSGTDISIKGGMVSAPRVSIASGNKLDIESLQDTSNYETHHKQVGGSATIGAVPSANLNIAKTKIDSTYRSVIEPSGINAGDEGFEVRVSGDTTVQGGVISSTQAAIDGSRNHFSTGGQLATTDIDNSAHYTADSVSVNLGTGFSAQGKLVPSSTGVGLGKDSNSAASTSHAAISGIAGDISLRTGDKEAGIAKIFDVDKVQREIQAQVTITQDFSARANKIVGDYVENQQKTLHQALKHASSDKERLLIKQQQSDLRRTEQALNILIGALTGVAGAAVTKEGLSSAAEKMRDLMIEDSQKFKGVTDGTTTITNMSGSSEGVRHDDVKLGGTRMDLDVLCGEKYYRCEFNIIDDKPMLRLNDSGQVIFKEKSAGMTLEKFLQTKDGKKLEGLTGGIQGAKGTLFGIPYVAGSWQDKLIEAFAGTHDLIGGKMVGLYDKDGNIVQGLSNTERILHDRWADLAIIPSVPFALAERLQPELWQAISVIIKGAK